MTARSLPTDTLILARRNLAHVRQIPEKLIDVTVQPLMFVLLFAYVFGGVIAVPGGDYREYMLPGIVIQTLAFGLLGPGVAIATDLAEGIVDRFRSLPMARPAFLLGHMTAELLASLLGLTVLTLTGLVVGWRIHSGVGDALAGFALLVAFAIAMLWVGTLVGTMVRSADAVAGIAFLIVFPLTFLSNAFVPLGGLPSALQTFAEWNPVSTFATAARTLFGNPTALPADVPWPLEHAVLASVLWCAALLAAAVPLTLRRFRIRTAG
jgi:ABC transporter DrrB family efflux protein